MLTHHVEQLLACGCMLGEGPIQHSSGDLLWVDIDRHQLFRWDRRGAPVVVQFDEPVSAVAETTTGELVVASPRGLLHIDAAGERRLLAALPDVSDELRMNDGKADPFGRFVGGTMCRQRPRRPVASLWSFGDGAVVELAGGVSVSNGLAWTADGHTMYHVDTPTGRVDAFDYDPATGAVANRRPFIDVAADRGKPDGICIDDAGALWVAMWGGSAVHRYVDGELAAVVEVPTPYVTCPTFAGPRFDELVITTAAEPFADDAPSGAGDLYVAAVGVTGPAPFRVDLAVIAAIGKGHH